ncbi:MAG: hypothetical protein ACI4RV_04250, partial [Eubacteriales bacterium]
IARQQADEQLSKAIEAESTALAEADAQLKKDLQSELAGKSPTDHTHTTLPTALALTDGKTSMAAYGFAFDNTVTGFADITITGTTNVTDFGQSFAPKNRTASSRWMNISVPSALMPRHASMPYTLRLTLSMAAQSGITPLEIMGLYKGGSGDVRVTPVNDAWTLSPGETKSFIFNFDVGNNDIKSAGFSIDLKAANAEYFDAMRFTVDAFTVLPSAKVKTDRKPAFLRFGERYIVPADAPDVNRAVNQFWYADGAVQSFLVEDAGVIDALVADPRLIVADMMVGSHEHIADNSNPHGVTAEQTGAYDKEQTDVLLAGKSDIEHTHKLAQAAGTIDLTPYGFSDIGGGKYQIETDVSSYPFVNYDISFLQAGDAVKITFTISGSGCVYINDSVYDTSSGVTVNNEIWEGTLTAPIRVVTDLCTIIMSVEVPAIDGFLSAEDKARLKDLQKTIDSFDKKLAGKSDVGHTHPLANVGVNTNLAGIEIQCSGYEGETEPTVVLSYRDETSTEDKYVFPNNQYYSQFSIFGAGDRVSLLFDGNCMITVNGKSI